MDTVSLNGWDATAFTVKTEKGNRPVAGWVKAHFALDFRVFAETSFDDDGLSGWQLTHVPTGFRIVCLLTSIERAMELADELAAAADWGFTDPEQSKPCSAPAKAFMEAHPNDVFRWSVIHGPLAAREEQPA